MATLIKNKTNKESGVNFKHINIKGEPDVLYLSDLEITTEGRIVNQTMSENFTKDYQISFTSNAMFMTMLNNEQYKMFVCKIISEITNFTFDYLMENANFYKNEINKDSYYSKAERGDLIIKMDNKYILVEMDMNNEIHRNVDYSDRVYRIDTATGKEYIYPEILLICFENFSYKEIDEDIMTFRMQTKKGICLIPRTYVLVFLPKLLKTWYHKNTSEELVGFYKTILTMYETSRKKAIEYARDDEIMERYLEESNKVQSIDNGLLRAYDHEQSLIEGMQKQFIEEGFKQGIEQGIEQGHKEGIEQGISKTRLENAISFIKKGIDKDFVIETLKLTEAEIKQLEL